MRIPLLVLSFFLLPLIKSDSVDANQLSNNVKDILKVSAAKDSIDWTSRAKTLITVLNANWYSRLLKEWMKNSDLLPLGVWHSWNGLEMLVDYSNYTGGDGAFDDVIQAVAGNNRLLQEAYGYNDDAAWAGIALIKAYRRFPSAFILNAATAVFHRLTTFWDGHCNGGVWWNPAKQYKNAITNELFLVLATDLYLATGQQYYKDWALQEYTWLMQTGMLNSMWLFNDGLGDDCKSNHQTAWTYNQGVILGGLVNMAKIWPQNATNYYQLADNIVRAVVQYLTVRSPSGRPILHETTVNGEDGEQFKGIFMRYLGQLIQNSPNAANRAFYAQFVLDSADYTWTNARNAQNEISAIWIGSRHNPPWYDAIAQISAADLMNAAVVAQKMVP